MQLIAPAIFVHARFRLLLYLNYQHKPDDAFHDDGGGEETAKADEVDGGEDAKQSLGGGGDVGSGWGRFFGFREFLNL